jgi:hypothetical protein
MPGTVRTGEAYLPVLEAIRQLCRQHPSVVDVLRAHAPMWLLQMPSLVRAEDREAFGREVFGATRERMLREMGDALDVLTAEAPLVLVLEDLHWSDYSTLDLISYLARQRGEARLMVVGTYRPAELIASGHPLKAVKKELAAKQQCEELPLEYLERAGGCGIPGGEVPRASFLASWRRSSTIGRRATRSSWSTPSTTWSGAGLVAADETGARLTAEIDQIKLGVPDSIRNLIEKADRSSGRTRAAHARGRERGRRGVLARTRLRQRSMRKRRGREHVRGAGAAPSVHPRQRRADAPRRTRRGTFQLRPRRVSQCALRPDFAARRVLLHKRLAVRGEQVYGELASEIAAELAMHFERASDDSRAARYLQVAAANAMRRSAYREAIALSRRGLELLSSLPDTPDRIRQELQLQLTLGVPLVATEGYAAPAVGEVYHRARALCDRLGDRPEIAQVLWGLWTFNLLRANLTAAIDIASEFLRLGGRLSYAGMAMRGHWALEITFTHRGDFPLAVEHFEKAMALYKARPAPR